MQNGHCRHWRRCTEQYRTRNAPFRAFLVRPLPLLAALSALVRRRFPQLRTRGRLPRQRALQREPLGFEVARRWGTRLGQCPNIPNGRRRLILLVSWRSTDRENLSVAPPHKRNRTLERTLRSPPRAVPASLDPHGCQQSALTSTCVSAVAERDRASRLSGRGI
jgi:hypothetical protein